MATTLELFLQGGTGNQLIQRAYAESLVRDSGALLRVNPLLLSPAWAALRGVTFRQRSAWLMDNIPETRPWPRQCLNLIRLCVARQRALVVHDGLSDVQVETLVGIASAPIWVPLLGYFQRAQAFGAASDRFWIRLAERLRSEHQLRPYPADQVALHVRLGDYLLPQNRRLFASLSIEQQLQAGLIWRERMGGQSPLHVITDDPLAFISLCPEAYQSSVRLMSSGDSRKDFLTLCCHRLIVATNSTFSLCAGKIAAMLWGNSQTTLLPSRWYSEQSRDNRQQSEWEQLSFLVGYWPLVPHNDSVGRPGTDFNIPQL